MLGHTVIFVRYNNVAKGICLLDKKQISFIQEKLHASKSFWKIYPLNTDCWFTLLVLLFDLEILEKKSENDKSTVDWKKNLWKWPVIINPKSDFSPRK